MPNRIVSLQSFELLLPEIILVLWATGMYVAGAFVPARRGWRPVAVLGLLTAAYALLRQPTGELLQTTVFSGRSTAILNGSLVIDLFGVCVRWLALAVGLGLTLLDERLPRDEQAPERLGSLLLIIAGAMLVADAADLVFLFLGLELISIPTYVVLYLGRKDAAGGEATAKYFFLSVLSSAVLLYGLSFLYGAAGSTRLTEVFAQVASSGTTGHPPLLARLGLVLVFAGLAFRLAAVPFHFYAPDVYQGTSHANAALLSIVPKIAGLAALARLAVWTLPSLGQDGWLLTLAASIATMTLGNVLALWQENVRRLLAYSSIAHAGYMLIGLAVAFAGSGSSLASRPGQLDGVAAAAFYLLAYSAATLGAFAVLTYLSPTDKQLDRVDELAGLGRVRPGAAAVMALFMFSLAGLPPLAGFWGKFTLFSGALAVDSPGLAPWLASLAVVGVVNAAIAAAYYLRVVAVMYFRAPPEQERRAAGGVGASLVMAACAVAVLVIGLLPGEAIQQINDACQVSRTSLRTEPSSAASAAAPVSVASKRAASERRATAGRTSLSAASPD